MRRATCILLGATFLFATPGGGASAPSVRSLARTEVVRWSPFDATGALKRGLRVTAARGRCDEIGYTNVGGIGYRCTAGNLLYNACFRAGARPTEDVVCTGYPWQRHVVRLRSPHLLFYPGVTFAPASSSPWGVVLEDGNRCGVLQGTHDMLTANGRRYVVDYECERGDLVLLREGVQRGRVWRLNAARWNDTTHGYRFLGPRPARRVYFGGLPPQIARQHRLAGGAYRAAARLIRERQPKARFGLAWVRLALPRADWAYVIVGNADGSRGWFELLRRDTGWRSASSLKPYCAKVPRAVRRQLFLGKSAAVDPNTFLAPPGETRC